MEKIFLRRGGDKERERGVLGIGWGGKEENRERIEGFWVMYGKERYTKYIVILLN